MGLVVVRFFSARGTKDGMIDDEDDDEVEAMGAGGGGEAAGVLFVLVEESPNRSSSINVGGEAILENESESAKREKEEKWRERTFATVSSK